MSLSPGKLNNFTLFNEDCLKTCKRFPDASLDLIYADPPFFTGRSYSMNGCTFNDVWTNVDQYMAWMKPRLGEFERVLKKTGTIYIHCDWHVSHYLKVLADEVFGMKNFINEIVWKRQSAHNDSKQGSKHFGRIHDTILLYANSKQYVWNQQYVPYDNIYIEQTYKYVESKTERRYALGDLTGPGGASKGNPGYEFLGVKRYWRYSKIKMLKLLSTGRIEHERGKVPLLKRYLDEMPGKPLQDLWTDLPTSFLKQGRFPTQKPESLLNRIILTSSCPNNLIYEPFAGSSTGAIVCSKLFRRWVGSEISKDACKFSSERMTGENIVLNVYSEPGTSTNNGEEHTAFVEGLDKCQ